MIEIQILNKILDEKDFSIIEDFDLSSEYFPKHNEEYQFIVKHNEKYNNVPDKATFLEKFPEFPLVETKEGKQYLVDRIREENLYNELRPVLEKTFKLFVDDSNAAVDFLKTNLDKFNPTYSINSHDLIKEAEKRLNSLLFRSENPTYIPSGFKELDYLINGWHKGEEYAVVTARTGEGKSYFLIKTLTNAWEMGYTVGFISPEMSGERVGYRFDTAYRNFSNSGLIRGELQEGYEQYIKELKEKEGHFYVSTPRDFGNKVTVTKIKQWAKFHKLDIIVMDGVSYIRDERYNRGDTKTITLTNISEDLMALSVELQVPVLVAVQTNRGGAKKKDEDGHPELEDIRDSDGLAFNASKVIAIRQRDGAMEITPIKNRDGSSGETVRYAWNPDKGIFTFIPKRDSANEDIRANEEQDLIELREKYGDGIF